MAITAELVTALGGEIDYVPLTPNARDFTVELPAGTWLVQVEISNPSPNSNHATLGGATSQISSNDSCFVTRIVQGGTLTGTTSVSSCIYTHGVALRLGD